MSDSAPDVTPRMVVILDTNVLVGNMPNAEPNLLLKSLLEAAAKGEMEIRIPSVVEAEWMNIQSESIREAAARFEGSRRRLVAYGLADEPKHVDAEAMIDARVGKLAAITRSDGVRVTPTTVISHDELVKRALQRRRPFRKNGAGYRDALIWQTVVEASNGGTRTIFVSNDLRDFGVGSEHSELHADLKRDLEGSVAGGAVELVSDLGKFVESHVRIGTRASVELKALGSQKGRKRDEFVGLIRYAVSGQSLDRDLLSASNWESSLQPDEEEIDVESVLIRDLVSVNSIDTVIVHEVGESFSAYLEIECDCELEIEQTVLRREWGESTYNYESIEIEWTVLIGVEVEYDPNRSSVEGVALQRARI